MASIRKPTKRILVVDDDPHARTIHSTWLSHAGYEVLNTESAADAVDLLNRNGADLVLTDLKMPGLDGWKLLDLLRGSERTRGIPVVALTIIGAGEDRRDPVRRGFDEHWVKPVEAADLLAGVKRLVG